MRLASARIPEGLARIEVAPLVVFALAVLMLAGAVHIATILLIPRYARTDGWSRLVAVAGQDRFAEIPAATEAGSAVPGLDPLFVNAACRLDLEQAPAALALAARERFWSLALYDPGGRVIFSLNDRTAVGGELDMLVVNPVQNAGLKENPSPALNETIVVESSSDDLVALLRLYAPTATALTEATAAVAAASCGPAPLEAPEAALPAG